MTPKQQDIYNYIKDNPGCNKLAVVRAVAGATRKGRYSNYFGYAAVNRMLRRGYIRNTSTSSTYALEVNNDT